MAGSVNKVILVGNLGQDPEIRRSNGGDPIVTLNIATSESWRDKNSGERREKTEWHRVVIFNSGIAKIAEQYLKKGAKVYIEGQLQTRKWEKDGVERYSTEVVLQNFRGELQMLTSVDDRREGSGGRDNAGGQGGGGNRGGNDRGGGGRQQNNDSGYGRGGGGGQGAGGYNRDLDDEIPFAPEWR